MHTELSERFPSTVVTEYSYARCWNHLDQEDFGSWYQEAIRAKVCRSHSSGFKLSCSSFRSSVSYPIASKDCYSLL